MKVKKGDKVQVLAGKDVGKQGTVSRVIPERDRVIVDGVNVAKKHQKPTRATMQGGIIDKDMPIHVSNVAIVCPQCGPTRVGYKFEGTTESGRPDRTTKVRICKKCGGNV
ncbi:MAG: 50S ribosomal protein L24 [Acidimicrobiia bacterium]